jgi:hypothetical protein
VIEEAKLGRILRGDSVHELALDLESQTAIG